METMITIGCDLATNRSAVALAGQYPFVYASIGVHPHEVKHITDSWYDELRQLARAQGRGLWRDRPRLPLQPLQSG